MKDKPEIKESAAAGKAGESTAVAEHKILTATGVSDLLKSEFAPEPAAPPEKTPAIEIPAEVTPGEAETVTETVEPPATETVPAEAGEGDEKTDEGETTTLPAEMQTALEAWEATGGPLPEALQAVVGKRIGKLTGARDAEKLRADTAEAELTKVKAEADALRNDPNRPVNAAPVNVLDEQTLTTYATTAQKMVAEIENYLDDSATDEERTRVERFMQSKQLDAKGLKRELRLTNAFLTQDLPELKKSVATFKAQEQANEPVAKSRFPWLDQKDTPEYQKAQEIAAYVPELRARVPAHKAALGTWVVGLKVLDALNAAGVEGDALTALQPFLAKAFPAKGTAAKAAPSKTPPPKAPAAGSAPPAKVKAGTDESARQSFNKTPNRQTATELARAALMAA